MRASTFKTPGPGVWSPSKREEVSRAFSVVERLSDPHPAPNIKQLVGSFGVLTSPYPPPYFLAQITGSAQNSSGQWAHSWSPVYENPDGTKTQDPNVSAGTIGAYPAYEDNNTQTPSGAYVLMRPGSGEWFEFSAAIGNSPVPGETCLFPTIKLLLKVCPIFVAGTFTATNNEYQYWNPCSGFVGNPFCEQHTINDCCLSETGYGPAGEVCCQNHLPPPFSICITFSDPSNEFPELQNGSLDGYQLQLTLGSLGNASSYEYLSGFGCFSPSQSCPGGLTPSGGNRIAGDIGEFAGLNFSCNLGGDGNRWFFSQGIDPANTTPLVQLGNLNEATLDSCYPLALHSTNPLKLSVNVGGVNVSRQSINASYTVTAGSCGSASSCAVPSTYLAHYASGSEVSSVTLHLPTVYDNTTLVVSIAGTRTVSSGVASLSVTGVSFGTTVLTQAAHSATSLGIETIALVDVWSAKQMGDLSGYLTINFSNPANVAVIVDAVSGLSSNAVDATATDSNSLYSINNIRFPAVTTTTACDYIHAAAIVQSNFAAPVQFYWGSLAGVPLIPGSTVLPFTPGGFDTYFTDSIGNVWYLITGDYVETTAGTYNTEAGASGSTGLSLGPADASLLVAYK